MKVSLPWVFALMAVAVLAGFSLGRRGGADEAGSDPGASHRTNLGRVSSRGSTGRGSGEKTKRSGTAAAAAAVRQLVRDMESTPVVRSDFELMAHAYEALSWMGPDEIRAALEELEAMGAHLPVTRTIERMLLSHWGRADGASAVGYALGMNALGRSGGVVGALTGWVREDPDGAVAWYLENRENLGSGPTTRYSFDETIMRALVRRDLDQAFTVLDAFGAESQKVFLSTMGSFMGADTARRERYLAKLEERIQDPNERFRYVRDMLSGWAFQDPAAAAAWVDENIPEPTRRESVSRTMLANWAESDPEAAAEWALEAATTDEARRTVLTEVAVRYFGADPTGAAEWMAEQPASLRSDELYKTAAVQVSGYENWSEAIAYSNQIEDPASRTNTLRLIYQQWRRQDQASAEEWIAAVPAGLREELEVTTGRDFFPPNP